MCRPSLSHSHRLSVCSPDVIYGCVLNRSVSVAFTSHKPEHSTRNRSKTVGLHYSLSFIIIPCIIYFVNIFSCIFYKAVYETYISEIFPYLYKAICGHWQRKVFPLIMESLSVNEQKKEPRNLIRGFI